MASLNKLNKTVDPTLLREAMKELGEAYGIKDKNSFVQLLLQKSATSNDGKLHSDEVEDYETNPQLKELADTIISLQGNGKWEFELEKAIKDYCSGAGIEDPIARQLLEQPQDGISAPFMSFTRSGSVTLGESRRFGFLRDKGVEDIISTMNQNLTEDEKRSSA